MDTLIYIVSWIFILISIFFLITGSAGMLRFPDFYTRLHPASITDTLAAGLIIMAMGYHAGSVLILIKLAFIFVLIFITSPTASHALAKAAAYDDLRP